MGFAIVAEFLLGTYRARRRDGTPDPLPSPARLHAALLNAAAQGIRAQEVGGRLEPSETDRRALEWIEANPPEALCLPDLAAYRPPTDAYRGQGMFRKWSVRVLPGDVGSPVAVGGRIGWIWGIEPPEAVRDALSALCRDVPHLGTAESPVVLRTGSPEPTHRIDRGASVFAGGGLDVEVPVTGRTAALEAAFGRSLPPPSAASDAVRTDESPATPPVEVAGLGLARYVPIRAPGGGGPWATALVIPLDRAAAPAERLAWCVALHRALIGLIGDDAPSLITGHYDPGTARPANRLSIQYLDPAWPVEGAPTGEPAFLLLVPADADPADLVVLAEALRSLSRLRLTRERVVAVRADRAVSLAGERFWRSPGPGTERIWVTEPAALPDSRPPQRRSWSLADAVLLSLGLVWRDRLAGPGHGPAWYARLAAGARAEGADVLDVQRLRTVAVGRYVHRVAEGTLIQPYRATLRLGGLAGDRTVVAIGQSRHLGGGLLVPVDLPAP